MCLYALGPWVPGSCPHPRAWGRLPSPWPGPAGDPQAATLGHNDAGEGRAVLGAWGRPCWANVAASRLGAGLGLAPPLLGPSLPGKTLPGSVPSSPGGVPGSPQPVPVPGARGWRGHPGDALGAALGAGTRSGIRPASHAQLLCHFLAHGDMSPVMEGLLALGNPPRGHFPTIPSPMGSSGLCTSPQHVDRGRDAGVNVGLIKRCARLQRLGVPAGSAGSVTASWLCRVLAN